MTFANGWIEMEIIDWLEQPFFNQAITIREVIKSVGDKEAAHSDENYNDTLTYSMNVKYYDKDSSAAGIIGLGDYVAEILKRNGIQLILVDVVLHLSQKAHLISIFLWSDKGVRRAVIPKKQKKPLLLKEKPFIGLSTT